MYVCVFMYVCVNFNSLKCCHNFIIVVASSRSYSISDIPSDFFKINIFRGNDGWSDYLFYAQGLIPLTLCQAAAQDLYIFENITVCSICFMTRQMSKMAFHPPSNRSSLPPLQSPGGVLSGNDRAAVHD